MTTAKNDSPDLEALFDSIAGDQPLATSPAAKAAHPPVSVSPVVVAPPITLPPAAKPAPRSAMPEIGDSQELQALFDTAASRTTGARAEDKSPVSTPVRDEAGWEDKQAAVFNRIGQMTRTLHDTLGTLGYDKLLEKSVAILPDTKNRLSYVASLTEKAACRVLNATDIAVPLVDQLSRESLALSGRWDQVFANQLSPSDFKQLAIDTRAFFQESMAKKIKITQAQLSEIMMAQDFQDLTGQVIKKIVTVSQELESNLMNVLLDVVPETKKTDAVTSLLNGPVINAEGRTDVVVNQKQVDDLLDSLGF